MDKTLGEKGFSGKGDVATTGDDKGSPKRKALSRFFSSSDLADSKPDGRAEALPIVFVTLAGDVFKVDWAPLGWTLVFILGVVVGLAEIFVGLVEGWLLTGVGLTCVGLVLGGLAASNRRAMSSSFFPVVGKDNLTSSI